MRTWNLTTKAAPVPAPISEASFDMVVPPLSKLKKAEREQVEVALAGAKAIIESGAYGDPEGDDLYFVHLSGHVGVPGKTAHTVTVSVSQKKR